MGRQDEDPKGWIGVLLLCTQSIAACWTCGATWTCTGRCAPHPCRVGRLSKLPMFNVQDAVSTLSHFASSFVPAAQRSSEGAATPAGGASPSPPPPDGGMDAELEDTQAQLAVAMAKIEAMRLRERHLLDELAQLRQQAATGRAGAQAESVSRGPVPAPSVGGVPASGLARSASRPAPAAPQPQLFTIMDTDAPLYVSSVTGAEHAVSIWLPGEHGPEKINCQLIIDKERIDFVQLRVRVRCEDFIGITAVKDSVKSVSKAEGSPTDAQCQGGGDEGGGGTKAAAARGRYRIYLKGREQRPVEFEASQSTRSSLHRHTQRWLGHDEEAVEEEALVESSSNGRPGQVHTPGRVVVPKHLVGSGYSMRFVGEPSSILSEAHVAALASAVPALERMRDWGLAYSTKVHGISLATLYRKMHVGQVPTITVIKDNGGHVFGCYTPEGWRVAPRYYGSGQTFVFQLEPSRVMWAWQSACKEKNDFFQYSTPDCMALGGCGHFAIHVDEELLQGSSGVCGTFGSPCLATREEFKVVCLEVWQACS